MSEACSTFPVFQALDLLPFSDLPVPSCCGIGIHMQGIPYQDRNMAPIFARKHSENNNSGRPFVSSYIAESITPDAGCFGCVGLCQLHTRLRCSSVRPDKQYAIIPSTTRPQ